MWMQCPVCKGQGVLEYDVPCPDYEFGGDLRCEMADCWECYGHGEINADPETVLSQWRTVNKLPNLDAFDLLSRETLTAEQKKWLTAYIVEKETEDAN